MEYSNTTTGSLVRSTAPRVGPLHAVAAVLLVLGVVGILQSLRNAPRAIDFSHYYITANILRSGADPYSEPLLPHCQELGVQYDERIPIGAHPPLLIRVFTWFCWLPLQQAFVVWAMVQAVCLFVLIETARRLIRFSPDNSVAILFVALVVCSTSVQAHWQYSQVQLFVGALVIIAYAAHRHQRHSWACGLAAVAAFFKLYPIVLLPWFVFSKSKGRRDIARRLGVIAAVGLSVLTMTGVDAWHDFFARGVPVIRAAGSSYSNYSMQAILARCLQGALDVPFPGASHRLAELTAAGLAGLAILAAYFCIWKRPLAEHVPICLLITVMIISAPVAWAHYMVLMIFPVAVLLHNADRFDSKVVRLACPAIAVMCLMPNVDRLVLPDGDSPLRLAVHFYPMYFLLAAAWLLIALPPRRATAEVAVHAAWRT